MTSTAPAPGRRAADPAPAAAPRVACAGCVVLAVLLVLAGLLSLAVGSRRIPLGTVIDVLFHPDGSDASTIVHDLRIPRTVLAIAVGIALGIAGALMQGHTRNPLADPGLLGVEAGAAFAVVIGIYVFGVTDLTGYAWFSLVGAGLAAAAVFAIGSTRGGPDPVSLVLAGTAVSALLYSLTQVVVLRDIDTLDAYRFWAVGSVVRPRHGRVLAGAAVHRRRPGAGRDERLDPQPAPARRRRRRPRSACTRCAHKVIGVARRDAADRRRDRGVRPDRVRRPGRPARRPLLRRRRLPLGDPVLRRSSAALLLLVADVIGRVVVRPGELQVGIVMALIGGPVFIVLVRRTRMVRI